MLNPFKFGLSKKLITFIVFTIIVFLSATSLISSKTLNQSAMITADEISNTLLDQTEKRITQFFNEMGLLAESLAKTKAVQTLSLADMKDLFISVVMTRKSYIRGIYVGTDDGRMFEWGIGKGFIDNVPTFPAGYDPRQRPWYKTALEQGKFSISAPYQYASIDELGITCILPVHKSDGSFIGVLGIDILLDDLKRILEELEIPKQGKALMLTLSGEIIASQFPHKQEGTLSLKAFSTPGSEKVLKNLAGSFSSFVDGQKMHFVFKRSASANWIIAVAMPYESILEPMRDLMRAITFIDAMLMLLLILSITLIANHLIISPLNGLVEVIGRIKQGEKARIPISGKDEFSFLGEELNTLLDIVEDNSRHLEEKVKQRTQEIVRLQAENTQYKIIEERQRIFRDMHDSIGAKLTNIFFCNTIARDQANNESPMLKNMIERIEINCMEAVQELKEIIFGMKETGRCTVYSSRSLVDSIRQRLQAKQIGFICDTRSQDALNEIKRSHKDEIENIFDEIVSNILKHSQALNATLEVENRGGEIAIQFFDDGTGFNLSGLNGSTSGLNNIRYRVKKIGGRLTLTSRAGMGTRFHISLASEGISDA